MPVTRPRLIRKLIHTAPLGPVALTAHDMWLRYYLPRVYQAINKHAKEALESGPASLTPIQERVVEGLKRNGIAHVEARQLLGDVAVLDEVRQATLAWCNTPEHKYRERQYRYKKLGETKGKPYEIKMRSNWQTINYSDPFIQFSIQKEILSVVNTYLGLMARVTHVDAWHTLPIHLDTPLIESQNWHRDPEDFRLVKVFLYLTNVDQGSGALQYILHSRTGEKYGRLFPQRLPYGSYPPPTILDEMIAPEDRFVCVFPADTLVFVDTTGFHRGGRAVTRDRIVATWEFTTQATWFNPTFKVTNLPDTPLPVEQRFALRIDQGA